MATKAVQALALALILATGVQAKPHKLLQVLEHVSFGAGVEIGMSQAAGGPSHVAMGMGSAAIVAGLKEYADYQAGKDTKKQAITHALTIVAGAGIAAGAWHK